MALRNHPLMSYKHLPNWSPAWYWLGGENNKHPKGEIGMLKDMQQSNVPPVDRCFLTIDYKGDQYMGCLLFDDISFCRLVFKLLQAHCGESVRDIGELDLS